MKTLWIFILIVLSSILGYAANPSFDTFDANDFNVVRNPPHISLNHSLLSATNIYATNLYTTVNVSSNIYATNLYSTNIYATNITATYITNYFATMDTTIINTLTANYFYAYSYIVNTNYGIWTNDNSAYPYSIVHILDDIPYSYVAMSNTLIKGTESVLSKSQTLVLGTNVLESGTRSQFLLISPTNDAAQVVIELNGGTNTVQKLEIYNLTNASPALGAFTLVANSAIPDSLAGGLVKLREGQSWVATNGSWIILRFVSPDWIEMDRGTLATPGGAGITINPTDGRVPYRSNSTTFADSAFNTVSVGASNRYDIAYDDYKLTLQGAFKTTAGAFIDGASLEFNKANTFTSGNLTTYDSYWTLNSLEDNTAFPSMSGYKNEVAVFGNTALVATDPLTITTGGTGLGEGLWMLNGNGGTAGNPQNSPALILAPRVWNPFAAWEEIPAFGIWAQGVETAAEGQGDLWITYRSQASAPTNVFKLSRASGYTGAGTNFLSDDGTYKYAGSVTTVNPSDLYFPVRSNATTFVDGPVHIPAAASTNVVLDGGIYFGSGLTNGLYLLGGYNLAYTNINPTGTFFSVSSDGSNFASYGVNGNVAKITGPVALYMQGSPLSDYAILNSTGLSSSPDGALSLGTDDNRWTNLVINGTARVYGYKSTTNYARLDLNYASTNAGAVFDMQSFGTALGSFPVTFTNQSTVVIAGTTNVVTFGGTSTAPADTNTIVAWVSVMVTGDTNAYRIPFYK